MRQLAGRFLCRGATIMVAATLTGQAGAHEFWLAPATFAPTANAPLRVDVILGDSTNDGTHRKEQLLRDSRQIESFVMIDPKGVRHDVPGLDGRAPVGVARPLEPGTHVFAYRGVETETRVDPTVFERYLVEEGLTQARERRVEKAAASGAKRADTKVVERFSRCAKAIVTVPGNAEMDHGVNRDVGLVFEITPVSEPAATEDGRVRSTFRLTYLGRPLPNAQILATSMRTPDHMALVRTDEDGRAAIAFRTGGPWRLHAVHMFEMPADDADCHAGWRSVWTSLVLALPETTRTDDGWREVPPDA